MGIWDSLSKATERAIDNSARSAENGVARIEHERGANLSKEQQAKLDKIKAEAQRGRDVAQSMRDKRR